MPRINDLLSALAQAGTEKKWQLCHEICFRILYGMSEEIQRSLARVYRAPPTADEKSQ